MSRFESGSEIWGMRSMMGLFAMNFGMEIFGERAECAAQTSVDRSPALTKGRITRLVKLFMAGHGSSCL